VRRHMHESQTGFGAQTGCGAHLEGRREERLALAVGVHLPRRRAAVSGLPPLARRVRSTARPCRPGGPAAQRRALACIADAMQRAFSMRIGFAQAEHASRATTLHASCVQPEAEGLLWAAEPPGAPG